MVEVAAVIAAPQLLEAIMTTADEVMGYVYAVSLFLVSVAGTLRDVHSSTIMARAGGTFGTSLIVKMFKHTLHRTSGAKTKDDMNINSLCGGDFFKVRIAHN